MMLPSNQGGSIYCGEQGCSHRIRIHDLMNSVRVVTGPNSLFDAPGVIVRRQPKITVKFLPAKDGSPLGFLKTVVMPGGRVIQISAGNAND